CGYERSPETHGWAVPRAGAAQWRWWYQQRLCVLIQQAGVTEAIALYSLQNSLSNATGNTPGQIKIWLWGWRTEAARQQLLRFFAQHRDQIHTVTMELPVHAVVHRGWGSIPHLTPVQMALPWMVRVVDLSHLPPVPLGNTTTPTSVAIAITDPLCPWNEGIWMWSDHQGILRCAPVPKSNAISPTVNATIEAVTALLYGTHTVAELSDRQWLKGDARSLEQFHTWFPPLAFYNPFKF
ncbi:MAG: hypothetical protein HC919_14950, partial [Oscillatoriales cyanobacterium SM2_2_1]|nr:hypothetical protein [Oscillatoriales cyanobacterium SM2_2_1]